MTRPSPADRRRARADARRKRLGRDRLGRTRGSNLGRSFTQDPDTGRMSGASRSSLPGDGLRWSRRARRRCDWCRGTGSRPITSGDGDTKTVIGTTPCDHRWSVADGGPGQKAADGSDWFVCGPCDSTGLMPVVVTMRINGRPSLLRMSVVCPTCQGNAERWKVRRGRLTGRWPNPLPKPTPQTTAPIKS